MEQSASLGNYDMIHWSDAANDRALEVITDEARRLRAQSEAVAKRAYADRVAPAYVDYAAATLHIGRARTGVADALLAVGPTLASFCAGLAIPRLSHPLTVGTYVLFAGAAVGLVLSTLGIASKVAARKNLR